MRKWSFQLQLPGVIQICRNLQKNQNCVTCILIFASKCICSESELLLVTRQNDNHSPGPGPGRLVPSSHQRSEPNNTILGTFSRGDKRVWKCIPVPNGLGGKATLINISVSNGNLICHRMILPATPNQGDKVICWYIGFTLQTFVYQYESTVSPPFLEGFPF